MTITRGDMLGNAERAAGFELQRELNKIGKPVDRGEWDMSPPTVNAYYDPQMNDINLPAGILQPPFFSPKYDDAVNFGATAGGTVGHEMTHGFDDEGRQYDGHGNLTDWWTKADAVKFNKRAQCVVDQYSGYVAVDDIHINGKLTLGENVADLGGVRLGYVALMKILATKPIGPIGGFTPAQRYFIAYAQSWCGATRPEAIRLRTATDPHSPPKYRVNGVVSDMPEFREAFSCKADAPMVRAKVCRVW
jgi:endothelin-converting enzyme/putative endopeptidase